MCDTAPVELGASLHSHRSRHVRVPLELPGTRNVHKYVLIHIHRVQCLRAVVSQPMEQLQRRQLIRLFQESQLQHSPPSAWGRAPTRLAGHLGTSILPDDSNGESKAPHIRKWMEFRHLPAQCLLIRIF